MKKTFQILKKKYYQYHIKMLQVTLVTWEKWNNNMANKFFIRLSKSVFGENNICTEHFNKIQ